MLTELCQELRNWFVRDMHFGTFEIEGGTFTADFLVPGQYYRIVGSIFNDGVHQYGNEPLNDETFDGAVWGLAIPKAVIELSNDIDEWRKLYETPDSQAMSPYMQESFDGYSYSKGSAYTGNAGSAGWKATFASRLNMWRKI